jgi:hypothetical protein
MAPTRIHHALSVIGRPIWLAIVGAPFAVVGFLTWIRDELAPVELRERLKVLELLPHWRWQNWVITGLVVVFVFVFERSFRIAKRDAEKIEILEKRLKPKIRVVFHADNRGVGRTPVIFQNPQLGPQQYDSKVVRLHIEALSDVRVTNCRAFLTALHMETPGGEETNPLYMPHPIPLRHGLPFDVYPEAPCTVDIAYADSRTNRLLVPDVIWPHVLNDTLAYNGTYHFVISIDTEESRETVVIAVGWGGNWETLRAREVRQL